MSIINDALKKVQKELTHKEGKPPAEDESTVDKIAEKPTIAQLPPPEPPPPSVIQTALTRAETVSTIQAADNRSDHPTASILAEAVQQPVKEKPAKPSFSPDKFFTKFKSAPKAAPKSAAANSTKARRERILTAISVLICAALILCIFVLIHQYIQMHKPHGIINGVMAQGNKNVVLIDNEVYEVGDVYSGARIVAISIDKVQFLENGILRTVKVKNTRQK